MVRDDMDVRPRRGRGGLEFGGQRPEGLGGERGGRPFRGRGGMRDFRDDTFRGGYNAGPRGPIGGSRHYDNYERPYGGQRRDFGGEYQRPHYGGDRERDYQRPPPRNYNDDIYNERPPMMRGGHGGPGGDRPLRGRGRGAPSGEIGGDRPFRGRGGAPRGNFGGEPRGNFGGDRPYRGRGRGGQGGAPGDRPRFND